MPESIFIVDNNIIVIDFFKYFRPKWTFTYLFIFKIDILCLPIFFQNGSQADGYELQSNLGTEGPDSIIKNGVTAQASNASASASKGKRKYDF